MATKRENRKAFSSLRAAVLGRSVQLRFFKSTPFFQSKQGKKEAFRIRIYRQDQPAFTFGEDYAEYFDGLRPTLKDLIFEGPLESINHRKYEFLDDGVRLGKTYAYWAGVDVRNFPPTGPVPIKVRDPRVWWPYAEVERRLQSLANPHGLKLTVRSFGTTSKRRPILGALAGNRRKMLALVGTLHPGEAGPELILPVLENLLLHHPKLLQRVGLAVLPSVNIEERERLVHGNPWYLRANPNGVDLNRNFRAAWDQVDRTYGFITDDPDTLTYRGPRPESEFETQAVVRFIKAAKPQTILSYHFLASIAGPSACVPKLAAQDKAYDRTAKRILRTFTRAFEDDPNAKPRYSYFATAGSLPAWAYQQFGISCFDLEGTVDKRDRNTCAKDKTTAKMVEEYAERHLRGVRALLKYLAR